LTHYANKKKGNEIKKKSPPMKLQSQSQSNLAAMIVLKGDLPRIISAKFG
jgi:hypothetical protein